MMNRTVFVEPGECWGRKKGEDGQTEACRRCVNICPKVFEKPELDRCARVRISIQLGGELTGEIREKARRAAWECPSDAIRWRPSTLRDD